MAITLSGMDATALWTGVQWADRAYIGNGRNLPRCFDGTAWTLMSIQKYNNGVAGNSNFTPTVTDQAIAGNLIGTYVYYVQPVNSKKKTIAGFNTAGIRSLPSAQISVGTTSAGSQILVSGIPATHADAQVDSWDIYRNIAGDWNSAVGNVGMDFKLIANIPIGTTQYQDNIDDVQLASTFSLRLNCNYAPAAKYMELYGSRIWFAGFDPISTGTVAKHAASFTLAGSTTAASKTVTMASTAGVVVGMTVSGTGLDLYTYVVSIVVNTSITLSVNANATGAGTTLTFDSPLVDFTSVTLPDGVLGCWFQVTGDVNRYRIVSQVSTTQLTLDHGYVGAMPASTYTIFRDPWEIYCTEYQDVEACGPDSEGRRYVFNLPDRKPITGLLTYFDTLLIFTRNDIYMISGQGPHLTDMTLSAHPVYKDVGTPQCRHYGGATAVATLGQDIYGLDQNKGPWVMQKGGEPQFIGYPLLLDWLSGLTDADASIAVCFVKGRRYVFYFVTKTTGDTENSKGFRYDIETGNWNEVTGWVPMGAVQDDGDNGYPDCYMIQAASMFQVYVGTSDIMDQSASAIKGTLTGGSASTATDTGAAFGTSGGGLTEAYVNFFDFSTTPETLVATARILSNTATVLTLQTTGVGALAFVNGYSSLIAGYKYEIGGIWWIWKSKTFEGTPFKNAMAAYNPGVASAGQAMRVFRAYVLFDSALSAGATLSLTEFVDGRKRGPHKLPADLRVKPFDLNVRATDFALQIESRDGATVRELSVYAAPKETKGGGA